MTTAKLLDKRLEEYLIKSPKISKADRKKLLADIELEDGEELYENDSIDEQIARSKINPDDPINIFNYYDRLPDGCRRKLYIDSWQYKHRGQTEYKPVKISCILGPAGSAKTTSCLYKAFVEFPRVMGRLTNEQKINFSKTGEMPTITFNLLLIREELEAAYDALIMPLQAMMIESENTFYVHYKTGPKAVKRAIVAYIAVVEGIPTKIVVVGDVKVFDSEGKIRAFRGTEYHGSIISEVENHPDYIFKYVNLRTRSKKNLLMYGDEEDRKSANHIFLEGQTPYIDNPVWNYVPQYGKKEIDENQKNGFIQVKDYPDFVNILHVCPSGLAPNPENSEYMGKNYWKDQALLQANDEDWVNKNIHGIPIARRYGEHGYKSWNESVHVAKVEYNPAIPIMLFSDADTNSVCAFVQVLHGQIKIINAVYYDRNESLEVFVRDIINTLQTNYADAQIGSCYIDPASAKSRSFTHGRFSPLGSLNNEFARQGFKHIQFQALAPKANSIWYRLECGDKLFRQLHDGRPGLLINNDRNVLKELDRFLDELRQFRYPQDKDGVVLHNRDPIKTTVSDVIGYIGVVVNLGMLKWADRVVDDTDPGKILEQTIATGKPFVKQVLRGQNKKADDWDPSFVRGY